MNKIFSIFLLFTLVLLLFWNFVRAVMKGDLLALMPVGVIIVLLVMILSKHSLSLLLLRGYAFVFLIVERGISLGAKSLIMLGGNSWEINKVNYSIDLLQVIIGIVILTMAGKYFRAEVT